MSGPKISIYSLTGRSREIVVGQMQCERESLACAARAQELLQKLEAFSGHFDREIGNIRLLEKRASEAYPAERVEALRRLQDELNRETADVRQELRRHMPKPSVKYWITEEAYAKKQEEMRRLQDIRERVERLAGKLEAAQKENRRNLSGIQESILGALGTAVTEEKQVVALRSQEDIIGELSGVYAFEPEEEAADTAFHDGKEALLAELSSMLRENGLSQGLRDEIRQAMEALQRIEAISYLCTFRAVTVKGLRRKLDAHREALKRQKELTARYEALCVMAGETPREHAAEQLEAEAARLEAAIIRQREQAYISECVDEVMSDMGYDLIGTREVRKRSGKQFRNELYTFGEGTAVNVTFSSDGQISMELGGLAREDRIPTAEETQRLTKDMEAFCEEFAEFEQRLRQKGIVVGDRIALSPPTAEYAAIINVNDYDVSAGTQITEMSTQSRRRQATEQQAARRDEGWS